MVLLMVMTMSLLVYVFPEKTFDSRKGFRYPCMDQSRKPSNNPTFCRVFPKSAGLSFPGLSFLGTDSRDGADRSFRFYNTERFHQGLHYLLQKRYTSHSYRKCPCRWRGKNTGERNPLNRSGIMSLRLSAVALGYIDAAADNVLSLK